MGGSKGEEMANEQMSKWQMKREAGELDTEAHGVARRGKPRMKGELAAASRAETLSRREVVRVSC
jgi:hypothetical protein